MKEQDLREKLFQSFYKELKEDAGFYDEETAKVCVQIAKDYAEAQNKELIIALTDFVSATTKEFAEINGFGQQRKRAVFLIEKYQLFKNRENER